MKLNIPFSKNFLSSFFIGFFLFGSFAEPGYFTQIKIIHSIYRMCKLSAVILSLSFLIVKILRSNKNNNILPLLIIVYWIYYVLLTFIRNGDLRTNILQFIYCITVCSNFYLALTWGDRGFLSGALAYYEIIIFINLFFVLIYPGGLYYPEKGKYYQFISQKNVILRYAFPGILFSLSLDFIRKKRIALLTWINLITLLITSILGNSATSMIALILTIASIFIFRNKEFLAKRISMMTLFAGSLFIFYVVIILRATSNALETFAALLNRNITFSGRIYLWDEAISYILRKPIWGYGFEGESVLRQRFFIGAFYTIDSCHNFYLDLAYRSGIIGLLFIFLIIFLANKNLNKVSIDPNVRISYILCFMIYFISWNFEPFVDGSIYNVFGSFVFLYYLWNEKSLIYRCYVNITRKPISDFESKA